MVKTGLGKRSGKQTDNVRGRRWRFLRIRPFPPDSRRTQYKSFVGELGIAGIGAGRVHELICNQPPRFGVFGVVCK